MALANSFLSLFFISQCRKNKVNAMLISNAYFIKKKNMNYFRDGEGLWTIYVPFFLRISDKNDDFNDIYTKIQSVF